MTKLHLSINSPSKFEASLYFISFSLILVLKRRRWGKGSNKVHWVSPNLNRWIKFIFYASDICVMRIIIEIGKKRKNHFKSEKNWKNNFWHLHAHILGEALKHLYEGRFSIRLPFKTGFYYDSYMGTSDPLKQDGWKWIWYFYCC